MLGRTKIVKFLGGLGNQMFQYAFFLSLEKHHKKVKADLSGFRDYELHHGFELTKVFGIEIEEATPFELRLYTSEKHDWLTRKLRRIYGTKEAEFFEREEFSFDPSVYEDASPRHFWGYWQHQQYVRQVEDQLRTSFTFKEPLDTRNNDFVQTLSVHTSIAVHVRRGDYIDHPLLGGICDLSYYQKGIRMLEDKIDNPLFVFFSNDMAWCRSNLPVENAIYVDWNNGNRSYRDMQLMSCCDHYVIANSSFSWWGAWLNPSHGKIVVSPRKWVNTGADPSALIHPNWIKI
jgi:hypothetical protein